MALLTKKLINCVPTYFTAGRLGFNNQYFQNETLHYIAEFPFKDAAISKMC